MHPTDPSSPAGPAPGHPNGHPYQLPYPYLPGSGPQAGTNGMSVAALACGVCGFIYAVPAILGIIFGCVGLSEVRRTGQQGRGMAVAGIVCGIAWLVLWVGLIILIAVLANSLASNALPSN